MWRCFTRAAIAAAALGSAGLVSVSVAVAVGMAAASPGPMKPLRYENAAVLAVFPTPTATPAQQLPAPILVLPPFPAAPPPAAPPAPPPPALVAVAAAKPASARALAAPATPSAALPAPTTVAPSTSAPDVPLTTAERAVDIAMKQIGKPYRYGGVGPNTFDCSGLTRYAYGIAGIQLPHSAAGQYRSGPRIARSQLQPGDLIFWRGLGHVGIYIGGGRMVHAPASGDVVTITSIDQGGFYGAVRPAA